MSKAENEKNNMLILHLNEKDFKECSVKVWSGSNLMFVF